MPALLRIWGYRFYFYSLEAREPPHIHVAHAGRYAKFWLEPVALAQNRGFRAHELTEINRLVVEHQRLFLEKWHEYLVERAETVAIDVTCTDDELTVMLSDGRTVTAPLAWFPRLAGASARQRADWELIGGGIGIHWEAVDEDISVASLLHPENFMRMPPKVLQPTSRAQRTRKKRPRGRAPRD